MDSDFRQRKQPAEKLQEADDKIQTFKTPDEVAAEPARDEVLPDNDFADDISASPSATSKNTGSRWRRFNKLNWPPGKKEWIIIVIILLLAGGGAAYALTHKTKPATLKPIPKVTSQTQTVPSTLTGLEVDPSVNQRTVTGVMIENSPDARPQSGLGQAGVVFEAVAEGGVTRFLALYQDTAPSNIGPVRSARPYYIQWLLGFDAAYAHVGGSPDGLADIKSWHVRDLDQFANAGAYHRISSRAAPHNVYTSISALNQLEVNKGYVTSHYTGFARKLKAAPHRPAPTAKSINIVLSGATYNAHYDYDAAINSYNRSEGGAPQIDANTNKQISPAVVITMVMPYSLGALDSSGAYYSNYNTIGSGPADIFQDGGMIPATWSKASNTAQFTFKDAHGQTIKLNPGQTWLTAVAKASDVSYAP